MPAVQEELKAESIRNQQAVQCLSRSLKAQIFKVKRKGEQYRRRYNDEVENERSRNEALHSQNADLKQEIEIERSSRGEYQRKMQQAQTMAVTAAQDFQSKEQALANQVERSQQELRVLQDKSDLERKANAHKMSELTLENFKLQESTGQLEIECTNLKAGKRELESQIKSDNVPKLKRQLKALRQHGGDPLKIKKLEREVVHLRASKRMLQADVDKRQTERGIILKHVKDVNLVLDIRPRMAQDGPGYDGGNMQDLRKMLKTQNNRLEDLVAERNAQKHAARDLAHTKVDSAVSWINHSMKAFDTECFICTLTESQTVLMPEELHMSQQKVDKDPSSAFVCPRNYLVKVFELRKEGTNILGHIQAPTCGWIYVVRDGRCCVKAHDLPEIFSTDVSSNTEVDLPGWVNQTMGDFALVRDQAECPCSDYVCYKHENGECFVFQYSDGCWVLDNVEEGQQHLLVQDEDGKLSTEAPISTFSSNLDSPITRRWVVYVEDKEIEAEITIKDFDGSDDAERDASWDRLVCERLTAEFPRHH